MTKDVHETVCMRQCVQAKQAVVEEAQKAVRRDESQDRKVRDRLNESMHGFSSRSSRNDLGDVISMSILKVHDRLACPHIIDNQMCVFLGLLHANYV